MTEAEKLNKMRGAFFALIDTYKRDNLPVSADFVKKSMVYLAPSDYARLYDLVTMDAL